MKVIRQAIVKQVLTEKSRQELFKKFAEEKKRYETECAQLDFERRKVLKKHNHKNNLSITARFNEEIKRRQSKINKLDFQIEQLQILPIGTEVIEEEIEVVYEIQEGDNWNQIANPSEIVIKDGVILEIRA